MASSSRDLAASAASTARWATVALVTSYSSPGTRQTYGAQLRLWFDRCEQHRLEPLTDVRRPKTGLKL